MRSLEPQQRQVTEGPDRETLWLSQTSPGTVYLRFFCRRGRKVLSLPLRPPVLSDAQNYVIMTDDVRSLATLMGTE